MLGGRAIVVVQAVQDWPCNEPPARRSGLGQRRVRVRDSVDALMHAGVVVPAVDVLAEDGAQLSLVPDEDVVEDFLTECAHEPADFGLWIWDCGLIESGRAGSMSV